MVSQTVKLKVRKLDPDDKAVEVAEVVKDIITAIEGGAFDAHIDVLFKAFDDRIRAYQGEEGDGELQTRERADKLRAMRSEPVPVIPAEGRHYRLRGSRYSGVIVMYIEMAGSDPNEKPLVMVEAVIGSPVNGSVKVGQRYKVPLVALEEIEEENKLAAFENKKPSKVPYGHTKCRSCGADIEYSGRGRPKSLCSVCEYHKN